MVLLICLDCSTRYAVGLSGCPHCHSTAHAEDGQMPKITRHGGPSFEQDVTEDAHEPRKDEAVPEVPEHEDEPQEGAQARQDQYDDMTAAQLREELGRRELDKSGKRPDLIVRLREDDVRKAD